MLQQLCRLLQGYFSTQLFCCTWNHTFTNRDRPMLGQLTLGCIWPTGMITAFIAWTTSMCYYNWFLGSTDCSQSLKNGRFFIAWSKDKCLRNLVFASKIIPQPNDLTRQILGLLGLYTDQNIVSVMLTRQRVTRPRPIPHHDHQSRIIVSDKLGMVHTYLPTLPPPSVMQGY